jgi:hypothetical protein
MGRRPLALALAPGLSSATLSRAVAIAATCGIDLYGVEPSGEGGRDVAEVRRLARRLQQNALSPTAGDPVAECAILYSPEADLWTGGRHRAAVERAAEALAALHVQAPIVLRVQDAPPSAALVLADAAALSALEAKQVRRRVESGGALLAFGEPGATDDLGRPGSSFLPSLKPGGARVGQGTAAGLPALSKDGVTVAPDAGLLEKALAALLGRGRRAASVAARVPVVVVLHRTTSAVLAHLVAPEGRAQGATLFLGVHVAGGARRARFVSADGQDVRIPMNPSGNSVSTVLPAFRGYAVVSLAV